MNSDAEPETVHSRESVPLVVDLDGTLTPVDTLHEALAKLVRDRPARMLAIPGWLAEGKAVFKRRVADEVAVDASLLPYNEKVLEAIETARREGRTVVLATASDRRTAEAVATHLGVFDDVIATEHGVNVSGAAKRDALVDRFGEGGFDYIGNDAKDLPVWKAARRALLADAGDSVTEAARKDHPDARTVSSRESSLPWLIRAARPYQWSKNVLVFVPVLNPMHLSVQHSLEALAAFICFCAAASSIYLINDILDLEADRQHPRKRNRPFASGRSPVSHGLAAAILLFSGALLGSWFVAPIFAGALLLYVFITINYSIWMKRYALLDVVVLAGLYTMRIIAGGAATGVELTLWLLGFSIFLFSSLAFAKRYSEVVELLDENRPEAPGRGYRAGDQNVLMAIGASSGMASVLTLALYLNSTTASGLYSNPEYLWIICPLLLYWISRIWLAAQRRRLTDDPIVFALSDRASRAILAAALVPIALALWR